MSKLNYYLSIDIEADGPIPGYNAMLSFGTVLYNEAGEELDYFYAHLECPPTSVPDRNTMSWWKDNQVAYNKTRENTRPPVKVMYGFLDWLNDWQKDSDDAHEGATITVVGYPVTYDFMFLYWYLMRYTGKCPFSFSGMDIKTMIAIKLNVPYKMATKNKVPWKTPTFKHTHCALDDAREQGALFFAILKDDRK